MEKSFRGNCPNQMLDQVVEDRSLGIVMLTVDVAAAAAAE